MDWTEILINNHPKRFLSSRGIECGEGWKELIQKFLLELDSLDPKNEISIFVIKEKFGLLTIQSDSCDEKFWKKFDDLASLYRFKSKSVCERCGEPGKMRSLGYWITTTCDNCKRKW